MGNKKDNKIPKAGNGTVDLDRIREMIIENTSQLVAVSNLDGVYEYISPSHILLGYKPEDLVGTSALDIVCPEDAERLLNLLAEQLSLGEKKQKNMVLDYRVRDKEGKWHHMESQTNYIETESGEGKLIYLSRDVTEKKMAEKRIKTSFRNYLEIFNSSNDAIAIHDNATGKILDVNDTFCELYGFTRDDIPTLNVSDITVGDPHETQLMAEEKVRRAAEGHPETFEWHCRKKDGTTFFGQVTLKPVNLDGEERVLAFVRNIDPQKRMIEELAKSEKMYRLLANNSAEVIWTVDLDGNFTYISPAVEHLRGFTVEEAVKTKLEDTLTEESYMRSMEEISKYMFLPREEHPFSWTTELEQICKDGSTVWTEVTVRAIYDDDEVLIGLQGATKDITDRKGAEMQLRKAKEKAEDFAKELERKNSELELFNKLSVGREVRMIELKKEVNKLARELGKEEPYDLSALDEGGD